MMNENEYILVWLKAFIPSYVPGYTRPVPGSPTATMVDDPYIPGCYLTDNRSFASNLSASARMTSILSINPSTLAWDQAQYCDATTRLDCGSGAVTCLQRADSSRMTFSNLQGYAGSWASVDLVAAASNPCAFGAREFGDLDYQGTVTIYPAYRYVTFQGYVEPFPAFEMYAVALETWTPGDPIGYQLFQKEPSPGAGPHNLPGYASEWIGGGAAV